MDEKDRHIYIYIYIYIYIERERERESSALNDDANNDKIPGAALSKESYANSLPSHKRPITTHIFK